MGKRSDFQRIEKDFYRTIDPRAVLALDPYLEPQTRFIEPCAGAGDLIDGLSAKGHRCVWAADIKPGRGDVLKCDARGRWANPDKADCIITNPPWSRPVLHELIDHFSAQLPTWLLFDADWPFTEQKNVAKHGLKTVSELMDFCTDVVPVGRLIWIPGTKMSSKDNCAWYRFDQREAGCNTIFHKGRKAA